MLLVARGIIPPSPNHIEPRSLFLSGSFYLISMSDSIPLPSPPHFYQWEDWKTKDLRNACVYAATARAGVKKYLRLIRKIMHILSIEQRGAAGGRGCF
jgi:hypothetical protein